MKSPDSLYRLIHSLDAREKRYFRLWVSRYERSDKNYLRLFEALQKMKTYDEDLLRAQFKGTTLAKNLPVEKHYLYELLMTSLAACHASETAVAMLRELLRQAELLREKTLFADCLRRLIKAKRIAREQEAFSYLLEVLQIERDLINDGHHNVSLEEITEEERLAMAAMSELFALKTLNNKFFALLKSSLVRDKEVVKQMKTIVADVLRYDVDQLHSARAKATWYGVLLRYTRVTGENEKQVEYAQRSLELMENNPVLISENLRGYHSRLVNMVISYGESGRFAEAQVQLEKVKTLPQLYPLARKPDFLRDALSTYYGLRLEMCLQQGFFEQSATLLRELEEWLKTYDAIIDRNHRVVIYMAAADLCFGNGEYRKTLKWLRGVVHEDNVGFRSDVQCFGRLLQVIVHYKQGNEAMLPSLLRSTYRFLLKRKKLFGIEKAILGFLRDQLRRKNKRVKLRTEFIALHRQLLEIIKDPAEKHALSYFNVVTWLESEIEDVPFAEIAQRNVQSPVG